MSEETERIQSRKERKEEGKRLKRERIAESGGVRPRDTKSVKKQKRAARKQQQNAKREPKEEGSTQEASGSSGAPLANTKAQLTGEDGSNPFLMESKEGATDAQTKSIATSSGEVASHARKNTITSRNTRSKLELKDNRNSKKSQSNNTQRKGFDRGESTSSTKDGNPNHRFGKVMEVIPATGTPRTYTVSMAIPGSILSNKPTRELQTLVIGQIARAATLYHVDEVVVYNDQLSTPLKGWSRDMRRNDKDTDNGIPTNKPKEPELKATRDPQLFFARLLQYAECPQYLRRHFFPMHPDLQYVGVMNPLDAPHHVRAGEESVYREGVVLPELFPKKGEEDLEGSHKVNCGILKKPVVINTRLTPGVRCTVQIPKAEYGKKNVAGTVVSPDAPREFDGRYWGYQTRLADSLAKIFDECPYEGGYDLKVGTSERGDVSIDDAKFALVKGGKETKGAKTSFQHAMIVFGGVAGIEECVDADESLTLPGKDSRQLFDVWCVSFRFCSKF